MPKQIFVVLSCAVLLYAGAVFADNNAVPAAETQQAQAATYKVEKGDTLWGIASKCYNDPWVWQKLWQANKASIEDPNLIYPDQVFSIPEKSALNDAQAEPVPAAAEAPKPAEDPAPSAVAAEEAVETAVPEEVKSITISEEQAEESVQAEETEPSDEGKFPGFAEPAKQAAAGVSKEELLGKKYFAAESMVVSKDWTADGIIAGGKEKKLMISEGDTVYINLGSEWVKPGMQFIVYRKIGKVKNPDKSGLLGIEIRRVGKLEATTDVGEDVCSAKVIVSYEPIKIGDVVKIISAEK